MKPIVEYDRSSDAAYIRLSSETVAESAELSDGIVLDYDDQGRFVGMEVLNAWSHLSSSLLDVG